MAALPPEQCLQAYRGGLVVAGERSGVGKTTVTLALLAALGQRSRRVQSFKVGPDYIDPMFHQRVTGRPCYNLDPILTSPTYLQQCFTSHCEDAEFALVEGVMGLFDGAWGESDVASTAHVARLLNLPVLLVVDCSRLARSVLAIVHGFRSLDPNLQLAGVVLNRVGSDRHLELLKTALASMNLPILGILHRQQDITIPDRHLGLVPAIEIPELPNLLDRLSHLGQHSFDWSRLEPLVRLSPPPSPGVSLAPGLPPAGSYPVRLALAQDQAFSFYYPDALQMLARWGVELIPWSPLREENLPAAIDGLYLGGGFPEMFVATLAANQGLCEQIRQSIQAGLPVYAECGGLMYLAQALVDFEGQVWPLVGVLPTRVTMAHRLTLGYRQATGLSPQGLLPPGQQVWGHEFHHSQVSQPPDQPVYTLRRYQTPSIHSQEGWQIQGVHASYLHLHWGGCPAIARRFLTRCMEYHGNSPGCDQKNPIGSG
ncbi:MAG: cobyrinate a,c-diamide synthase [Nodosilinea sp.]